MFQALAPGAIGIKAGILWRLNIFECINSTQCASTRDAYFTEENGLFLLKLVRFLFSGILTLKET